MPNLRPRSPVELGLCGHEDLAQAIEKGLKAGRQPRVVEPLSDDPSDNKLKPFAET